MLFDFTPDPKVLLALTHTPMQPLDALCELIDNAIDSFATANIQGVKIDTPMVVISLPSRKQLLSNSGIIRIYDNGPGMTAENAEKAIKAGFSGNNPYDTLGLFGMGFNISTGKLGNITKLMTARQEDDFFIQTVINLTEINETKNYSLKAEEISKSQDAVFKDLGHGTIIEISGWWPEGNANCGFVSKLIQYGLPKIREEIGRRYATILRTKKINIIINDVKCTPYEHCVWSDQRYVEKKSGKIPAVIHLDTIVGSTKRCGKCTAIIEPGKMSCPSCGSTVIRTIDERVYGWIGIQRFDSDTDFGIDLIRNGRSIKIAEKQAFFEYVDEFKHVIKDYPIDQQYGRIVGEIHLDFVPVDFLKQDFQRSSIEWQKAMSYIRGESSLQPTQPNAGNNHSPMFMLYQGYRRVRQFGRGDMYMGYWDADSRTAKRISRDTEEEYYDKFLHHIPGFYDDAEWWKLVESADQPPVAELIECPECGAQNLKEADLCIACNAVLRGKNCLNDSCKKLIPISSQTCPYCGVSQKPIIIEPWICLVCHTKNAATENACTVCKYPRGTEHPLAKDELLKNSTKSDALSGDNFSIDLPNSKKSMALKFETYSTLNRLEVPITGENVPIIVHKDIGHIQIFIDFSHPLFTKYNVLPEQCIANELALYIYDDNRHLLNAVELNLSNLANKILFSLWREKFDVNQDIVAQRADELLNSVLNRLVDSLKDDAEDLFAELSSEQKKSMTEKLIQKGVDLSTIASLKNSGEFIYYVPFNFILSVFDVKPDAFFDGGVWRKSLLGDGEELLGKDIVAIARNKIIQQYRNYLQDVIIFLENKYSDQDSLRRTMSSIQFLKKGMVE